MPNLRHVFGGLGSPNGNQTCVDELLQTIAGFGRHLLERSTNSFQGAVILVVSCHRRVASSSFHILNLAEGANYQLRHLFCIAQDTFGSKEEEFSALNAAYFHFRSGCRRCASNNNHKQ